MPSPSCGNSASRTASSPGRFSITSVITASPCIDIHRALAALDGAGHRGRAGLGELALETQVQPAAQLEHGHRIERPYSTAARLPPHLRHGQNAVLVASRMEYQIPSTVVARRVFLPRRCDPRAA